MTTEEIALRILCAQIESGKDIGAVSVREAFAMAVTFEEQAKQVQRGRRPRHQALAYDDNGQ